MQSASVHSKRSSEAIVPSYRPHYAVSVHSKRSSEVIHLQGLGHTHLSSEVGHCMSCYAYRHCGYDIALRKNANLGAVMWTELAMGDVIVSHGQIWVTSMNHVDRAGLHCSGDATVSCGQC